MNIIFKDNQTVSYITWGLVLVIIIVHAFYTQGTSNPNTDSDFSIDNIVIEKHPETKYGELNLDIGASEISLDSTNQDLLSADIKGRQVSYRENYKNNYEAAIVDIETRAFRTTNDQSFNSEYNFYLNKDVIWDVDFDMGAISGQINLDDIPVRKKRS